MLKASTLTIGDTIVRFLRPDVATALSVFTLSGMTLENGQVAPTGTAILTHVLARIDGHWLIIPLSIHARRKAGTAANRRLAANPGH
jgi:hypothetical protein